MNKLWNNKMFLIVYKTLGIFINFLKNNFLYRKCILGMGNWNPLKKKHSVGQLSSPKT